MVGHVERFNPVVIALRQHLSGGELGRVFQMDAHRQGPFPDRIRDVGVVIDLAVHDLDVMRYVCGAEIVRVYAETERHIHSTFEDLLTGIIRLSDGTIGTLRVLRGVSEGRMIRHVVAKKEPLRAELESFCACVCSGAPVPVTGEDGLMAVHFAQALVTSGLEHRAIDLPALDGVALRNAVSSSLQPVPNGSRPAASA